ncbi:hypothetical protein EYF80_018148 [Liparis tanakae]|uniref:Uncharacterized protein n=1 Tax=Liparis tanakae TaxID=230148 RepID=A0A4Z2I306_9TELE|nr:hypothetical protein EYF80_018148 [Liparis tanakae]
MFLSSDRFVFSWTSGVAAAPEAPAAAPASTKHAFTSTPPQPGNRVHVQTVNTQVGTERAAGVSGPPDKTCRFANRLALVGWVGLVRI